MDADYRLRYINRWYSKTFHTPLHVVDDLPTEDVLIHFYECQFEDLEEAERLKSISELLESIDERKKRLLLEADDGKDGEAWFKSVLDDVKAGRDPLKRDAALVPVKADDLPDAFKRAGSDLAAALKKLEDTVGAEAPDEVGIDFEKAFGKLYDENEPWDLFEDPKPKGNL
jgi:hypothetical protein